MTFKTTSTLPQTKQKQHQQQQQQQQQQSQLRLKRKEGDDGRANFTIKKSPQHLLAYSITTIFLCLCWLPDSIVALKDVSVTIPQAVKRGSNAMLTCNYDMENDTLYSVKWYKGRREFYRYTPKENPAMKVFPSQSGLNVERNLSNQSHVVLLAVPLNISGKFTCEISVEAPSFQTAMVSGEMEVVELPEEQATVTGIQPRYRIGDLVDGNCSIKYSKPAANLTWTINGIVVPPHHIKTYQIEKYEETNLESVMSAIHFMVTTQHFFKGQMRLKCTASIFDIFKEEIESIIEEDRPRIMASGQSYPPDHGYGTHGDADGYEHNESYLTYFSAPKSSASPTADFVAGKILVHLKQKITRNLKLLMASIETYIEFALTVTCLNDLNNSLATDNLIKVETTCYNVLQLTPMRAITTALVILLIAVLLQIDQRKLLIENLRITLTQDKQLTLNCLKKFRQMVWRKKKNLIAMNLWHETTQHKSENENCYQDNNDDDCQAKCGQQQQQQYQHVKHFSVANQNIVNEEDILNDTNINTINSNSKNNTIAATTAITRPRTRTRTRTTIDCQHHMSQALAFAILPPTSCASIHLPPSSSLRSLASTLSALSSSSSSASSSSSLSSLSLARTLGRRKTYAHDSFPLFVVDASKSNNAKYVSKDRTLLMTFTVTAANTTVVAASLATSNSLYETQNVFAPITATATSTLAKALALESKLLQTSVHSSSATVETNSSSSPMFSTNNYLMAFIGELLLHQC